MTNLTTNLTTGLIVSAVVFVPLAVMVYHAAKAPEGYQDDDGFHLGEPPEHSDYDGDAL